FALKVMGILLALGRGTAIAAAVMFAFAILKRLVIVFGLLLALIKFLIVIAFLVLFISIAVAMIREWSRDKNGVKNAKKPNSITNFSSGGCDSHHFRWRSAFAFGRWRVIGFRPSNSNLREVCLILSAISAHTPAVYFK